MIVFEIFTGNRKIRARILAQSIASLFPQKDFQFFKFKIIIKLFFIYTNIKKLLHLNTNFYFLLELYIMCNTTPVVFTVIAYF